MGHGGFAAARGEGRDKCGGTSVTCCLLPDTRPEGTRAAQKPEDGTAARTCRVEAARGLAAENWRWLLSWDLYYGG